MACQDAATPIRVVFVTTEVAPWSKVGGLADVIAALPAALAARGHDVMTVAPRYAPYEHAHSTGVTVALQLPPDCTEQALPPPSSSPPMEHFSGRREGRRRKRRAEHVKSLEINESNASERHGLSPSSSSAEGSVEIESCAVDGMREMEDEGGLPDSAELFMAIDENGVRRVFVDHPILQTVDIYAAPKSIAAATTDLTHPEPSSPSAAGDASGAAPEPSVSPAVLTYLEARSNPSDPGASVFTYQEAGAADSLGDLDLRYSILCQAALAAPVLIPHVESGQQKTNESSSGVVFIANDWPAALQLLRLKFLLQDPKLYSSSGRSGGGSDCGYDSEAGLSRCELPVVELQSLLAKHLATAATALCIHNLAYQGVFPGTAFARLCLPSTALPALCTTSNWRTVLRMLRHANFGQSCPCGNHEMTAEAPCSRASSSVSSRSSSRASTNHPAQGSVTDEEALLLALDVLLPHTCRETELINFMRAAVLAADEVVTVSPTYAREIQEESAASCGLGELLAARGVTGIMNGIDTIEWDPSTDPYLPTEGRFDVNTFTRGKAFMKAALQRRLGLKEDSNAALAVFVGRLTEQKGVDLLLGTIPVLFAGSPSGRPQIGSPSATHHSGDSQHRDVHAPPPPLQMAMLGSGEQWMQTALSGLSHLYPGQAVGVPCFSEELAHWMLAAADYVLVPSRFEPCGLVAQCGARYGAVPIVNAVGGLKDLVSPDVGLALPAPSSTGGAAERRVDVHRWAEALRGAAKDAGEPLHRAMQRRGMSLDLSWRGPALEWERVLRRLASLRSAKEQQRERART